VLFVWADSYAIDRSRQALRAIEKGEFEKAEEFLDRSYNSDSLNPLVSFAYCRLYVSPEYNNKNLDSARSFIKLALKLFPNRTEEHGEEMNKAKVEPIHFDTLKRHVDSLGFVRAQESHTIAGYNSFMLMFEDASEVREATLIRNQLLYEEVQNKNVWQSYLKFFKEYPDAIEAVDAESKYHELIYNEKAKDASTADLEDFLTLLPQSPYKLLVEQQIFYDKVSSMNVDSIYSFIHRYSNDSLTLVAMDILYHWNKLYRPSLPSNKASMYETFIDSVYQIEVLNEEVLMPFYEDGVYAYRTLSGDTLLSNVVEAINLNHLCGNVIDEILEIEIRT